MRLWGILVVATIATMLASLAIWRSAPRQLLVERLNHELTQIPDEDVPTQLAQLGSLGDDGLAALAAALGSTRGEVASKTRQVLEEQLESWKDLPVEESSKRVAVLARSLAERRRTECNVLNVTRPKFASVGDETPQFTDCS
jgi:hypothetical protein